MRLWNVANIQCEREFKDQFPDCIAYGPDGQRLIAGYGNGFVRIFDVSNGRELQNRKAHGRAVKLVAFRADGNQVVSAGSDQTISIWDLRTGSELHRIAESKTLNAAALCGTGDVLLVHWGKRGRAISGSTIQIAARKFAGLLNAKSNWPQ